MKTKQDYINKLESLKSEQMSLISLKSRKRDIRNRIQEITKEFFYTKAEWRSNLGQNVVQ